MPTDQHHDATDLGFRLPPNITVTRQLLPNGMAYVFRDFELGELGRLAVESTPTGETQIVSEVAGDASDPTTRQRLEVLDPICKELTRILESVPLRPFGIDDIVRLAKRLGGTAPHWSEV